jgi:hypothetical protein
MGVGWGGLKQSIVWPPCARGSGDMPPPPSHPDKLLCVGSLRWHVLHTGHIVYLLFDNKILTCCKEYVFYRGPRVSTSIGWYRIQLVQQPIAESCNMAHLTSVPIYIRAEGLISDWDYVCTYLYIVLLAKEKKFIIIKNNIKIMNTFASTPS